MTWGSPLETISATVELDVTVVPATGLSLITRPAAIVELLCVVTLPTTSAVLIIAVVAAVGVSPSTLGTVTFATPVEITRFTAEPDVTVLPAAGLSLMTPPEAVVELLCFVTVPTTRPALVMALVAAVCVIPFTFGTAICVFGTDGAALSPPPQAVKTRKTIAKMQWVNTWHFDVDES
jgi:hypothetical protein